MKISKTDACPHCPSAVDTHEHALFACSYYTPERSRLEHQIGDLFLTSNLLENLLSSKDNWMVVCKYVKDVMESRKKTLEAANAIPDGISGSHSID